MVFKKPQLICWLVALMVVLASADSLSDTAESNRHAYVIGASVSMGFNLLGRGHSPSIYALKNMGYEKDNIIKKTVITGSFQRKYKWFKQSIEKSPPSIIMGIDLFHHDLRKKSKITPEKYAYFDDFIETLTSTGVPVIIGSIWTRYENQETVDEMNAYLEKQQQQYPNLYIFQVADVLNGLTKQGQQYEYDVDGVQITLHKKIKGKLLLDVVHPNNRGARIMSNLMIKMLNEDIGIATPYYDVSDVVVKLSK